MGAIAGQRVVIVGGSSGMGKATAALALERGATVVIGSHNAARLEAARAELVDASSVARLEEHRIDVLDEASIAAFFEEVGQLDHLFVTAAPSAKTAPLLEQDLAEARRYIEGKFWGSYLCARQAAARLSPRGSIVLLSGGFGHRPAVGRHIVTVAQRACEALSEALAIELAPARCNAIVPGAIDTEMWDFMDEAQREAFREQIARDVPLGRMGQGVDVAHAVLFCMENDYLTGESLALNGGQFLR